MLNRLGRNYAPFPPAALYIPLQSTGRDEWLILNFDNEKCYWFFVSLAVHVDTDLWGYLVKRVTLGMAVLTANCPSMFRFSDSGCLSVVCTMYMFDRDERYWTKKFCIGWLVAQ